MTLLVVSPDYASHLLPLAALATAWRDRGERVVVATGPATAPLVAQLGFERADLRLGRGSNPGVIRPGDQPRDESASLRGFFAATREGAVATLRYQAQERLVDLMWRPVESARATLAIVEQVAPRRILVDHLAFGARLGLHAAGVPYGDVVLGHPTALPVAGELYGYPTAWPRALRPDPAELAGLRALCAEVTERFTAQWNDAVGRIDPGAPRSADAFAEHGPIVLYNYPEALADPAREPFLPPHVYLGAALRDEPVDPAIEDWVAAGGAFVYVSLGSFLSERADVLRRVADAARTLGVRVALATGSADPADLGDPPPDWLVRDYLPQVRLLRAARAAVTHGGNNSITEAVACGVPLLVLPLSTDQFAGAAAVERAGIGVACDPNAAGVDDLAAALGHVLDGGFAARADAAARTVGASGAQRAYAALEG